MSDYQIFEAGDVVLQSGLTYRGARLAYKVYDEFAALAQCDDHERGDYFSDLMSSESRWNFA